MRIVFNNEATNGEDFVYAQSAFTGSRTLLYCGVPLRRLKGNEYGFSREEGRFLPEGKEPLYGSYTIKGNLLSGVYIHSARFPEPLCIRRPLKDWEIFLCILPMLLIAACAFFGALLGGFHGRVLGATVCGGICGGLAGGSFSVLLYGAFPVKKGWKSALIVLEVCLVCGLAAFLLGYASTWF